MHFLHAGGSAFRIRIIINIIIVIIIVVVVDEEAGGCRLFNVSSRSVPLLLEQNKLLLFPSPIPV
jgi:hypothetical protein